MSEESKYLKLLQESVEDYATKGIQYEGPAKEILNKTNVKGGRIKTHEKRNDIVQILEKFYFDEDNLDSYNDDMTDLDAVASNTLTEEAKVDDISGEAVESDPAKSGINMPKPINSDVNYEMPEDGDMPKKKDEDGEEDEDVNMSSEPVEKDLDVDKKVKPADLPAAPKKKDDEKNEALNIESLFGEGSEEGGDAEMNLEEEYATADDAGDSNVVPSGSKEQKAGNDYMKVKKENLDLLEKSDGVHDDNMKNKEYEDEGDKAIGTAPGGKDIAGGDSGKKTFGEAGVDDVTDEAVPQGGKLGSDIKDSNKMQYEMEVDDVTSDAVSQGPGSDGNSINKIHEEDEDPGDDYKDKDDKDDEDIKPAEIEQESAIIARNSLEESVVERLIREMESISEETEYTEEEKIIKEGEIEDDSPEEFFSY